MAGIGRRGFLVGAAATAVVGCASSSPEEAGDGASEPVATTRGPSRTAAPTTTTTVAVGGTNSPGTTTRTIELEGLAREVIVHVPASAAGDDPVPVVIVLHGTSGDGLRFFNGSGWREKADAEGFIALFPSSLTYCLHDEGEIVVTTKWNSGLFEDRSPLCTPEELAVIPAARRRLADHLQADDVAFTAAMLDLVAAEGAVDPSRVYVTGFSNGGQMAARLSVDLSERFAAVAIAAGNYNIAATPAAHPLSIVYSIGTDDDRFMLANGGQPLPAGPAIFDLPFFAALRDDMLTVTGLGSAFDADELRLGSRQAARLRFADSPAAAGNELLFVVVEGMAHEYPNLMPGALWEFFGAHTL